MQKLLLFVLLLGCLQARAQQNTDSLIQRIKSLESALQEKNYQRVPVGDLDKALAIQVKTEVETAFQRYLIILGLIIFGGGFGVYRTIQSELRKQSSDEIKEKINSETDTLEKQLNQMIEVHKRENERQDLLIASINENMKMQSAKQEGFVVETIKSVDKKISATTEIIWNDIADNKIRIAEQSAYKGGAQQAKDFSDFLSNESVKVGITKRRLLIDTLMRLLYSCPEGKMTEFDDKDKYTVMINLLKKYESDLHLLPETFANAAIALNNQYEFYRRPEDKALCIDCCDKSLQELRDYGIPYVIKLEIHAMDFLKAFDQKEKDESLDQIKRILHSMNENQSGDLYFEAVQRLLKDKELPYLKPYIEMIEAYCSKELQSLKEKAVSAIVKKEKWLADEGRKGVLIELLKEGTKDFKKLNGTWQAVQSTIAGQASDIVTTPVSLKFLEYNYQLTVGDKSEIGYLYLQTGTDEFAMNFYTSTGTNIFTAPALATGKLETDGSLVICSNFKVDGNRPAQFISTTENGFYLETFLKTSDDIVDPPNETTTALTESIKGVGEVVD
jgi:hypothetical protein